MSTIIAYRTRSNTEHKTQADMRRAGIRAYVPRDRSKRRSPFTGRHPAPGPGYIFAANPYFPTPDKPACIRIGTVTKEEIGRLYIRRESPKPRTRPFSIGDKVRVNVGPYAGLNGIVTEDRGKKWQITVQMFGRSCGVLMKQRDIQRILEYG